jgi:hypothetical protein
MRMNRWIAVIVVLGGLPTLGACSGEDDDAAPNPEQFCDEYATFALDVLLSQDPANPSDTLTVGDIRATAEARIEHLGGLPPSGDEHVDASIQRLVEHAGEALEALHGASNLQDAEPQHLALQLGVQDGDELRAIEPFLNDSCGIDTTAGD